MPKLFYYDIHKTIKNNFFFHVYIKTDQENIWFYEYNEGSYKMVDQYLYGRYFGYEDSYNYYDIDADKISLYKKSDNEYFLSYNDVNKMTIVPLKLKMKIALLQLKIHKLKNNITLMSIKSDNKELFKKIREIWNKIIELIGVNNSKDFVKNTVDDNADELLIIVDVPKNASIAEGNYRGELVIVLHSVIDNYLKTSLVQVRKHNYFKYIY